MPGKPGAWPGRIFRFLASLRLAVVLLLALAVILAAATWCEARYDAATARHLVYGSGWFQAFLCMLGVNVACAAAIRYPWKRHQTGFVITHLGIIVILIGSFVTVRGGFEGTVALADGQTARFADVDRPMISYQGMDGSPPHDLPAEFRWWPPSDRRAYRYHFAHGLQLVVDRYYHHARRRDGYQPGGPRDAPAVRFRVGRGAIQTERWLALTSPQRAGARLGAARVTLERASALSALPPLPSGDGIELAAGPAGQLWYRIRSADGRFREGAAVVGRSVATGWRMGLALTILQWLPHARPDGRMEEVRGGPNGDGPPPAIRARLLGLDLSRPFWLRQGDSVTVRWGATRTRIGYHLQQVPLGCALTLRHFQVDYDPGTQNPAAYCSQVSVDRRRDFRIAMNDPLHYRGMTFFQASFHPGPGRSTVSVLQVVRDPGVPIKYAGSLLLVAGIAIMFFWKPGPPRRAT